MKQSIYKNGKNLRYGFTTGSCAAAASKAAAIMMTSREELKSVELMTPKGWLLTLDVVEVIITDDYVSCGIVKDSGDDPDITNGITIYSKVSKSNQMIVTNGVGVGTVTKKGISVPVGEPAINPVPRKMILDNVQAVYNLPLHIEISAPEGVEISKKTFNPKLGIIGGISIIGTTGIVEPMSEEAFKDSLKIELDMIEATSIVLAPGNYGRDYCLDHHIEDKKILKISNFVGFMFDRAVEKKIEKVLFVGHIGKLIKVAGGIFHTHSRISDARMDILVSHMVRAGVDYTHLEYVLKCNTTEEAVNYLVEIGQTKVFQLIANSIKDRLEKYTFEALEVEVVVFSLDQGFLSKTEGADRLLEVLSE